MVYIALCCSAVLIGIDQLIKWWAVSSLAQMDTLPIIQDVLHLTYYENRGAAFSILQNQRFLLIGFTAIVLAAILVLMLLKKIKQPFVIWCFALILAGGVGNLIDRIVRGYVVDYVDVRLINFAVFNFADCCVVVGTLLLLVYVLFLEGRKHKNGQTELQEQTTENPVQGIVDEQEIPDAANSPTAQQELQPSVEKKPEGER